jgi:hypothetical protein
MKQKTITISKEELEMLEKLRGSAKRLTPAEAKKVPVSDLLREIGF